MEDNTKLTRVTKIFKLFVNNKLKKNKLATVCMENNSIIIYMNS